MRDVRPSLASRRDAEPGYCPRCGAELDSRRSIRSNTTWALIIAAAICYIPANALPVLDTTRSGETESDTIIGGVIVPL